MDKEILYRLKEGNYEAFQSIYHQWKQRVFSYMLYKIQEEETAKDLTQNTFIKLWEYRSSVSTDCSLEQQIFQKARLIFIDHLRREFTMRQKIERDNDFNYLKQTAHQAFEEKQLINLAMDSLPKSRREIFQLKYIEGYSYNEIAHLMSISPKTVDNQLVKALKHLRKFLQKSR